MPVRRRRRREARRADRAHRAQLALLPARRRARPALRLPRPRPLRARERPPLQPGQAADRPLREGDRGPDALGRGQRAALRPDRTRDDADLEPDDEDDVDARPQVGGHRPALRLGGRPPPASRARDGDLRDARQGLHEAAPRRARGPARHLRRARLRARDRLPQGPRRHRGRAAARPPHRRRVVPGRARASPTTGATRTIGYLAPHSDYAATGQRGEEVREFKGMVKALHRAGIEVILDVVYNHTAEGNHLGPMLSFKGVDNTTYYRLVPDDPRHYMDYTGTGNTLNAAAPERAAADHGLAALLGDRVPRRRLPLRPRLARSRASSTTSTACRRSSTSSTRTRCSRRSS